ncbi:MAG TPA: aldo/keto reductase [Polyangiales bacterium]|nr:aldo/keto reductase [Polyangiales bacterium]
MSPATHAAASRLFTTRGGRHLSFSTLGFGSGPLGNYLRPLSEPECDELLESVWTSGVRYFDTAPFYGLGLSETRLGRLLARHAAAPFTIASKVGRLLEPCTRDEVNGGLFVETPQVRFVYDYSYDGVMRCYESTLARTGLTRLDILYVHDVCSLVHGSREAAEARIRELVDRGGWRALDELRASGRVAALGAGVNEWQACARMLEVADPDLFLLAGRYTLLEQEPLEALFPRCAERGVGIVVGGPLNSGILAGGTTYNYAAAPAAIVERVRRLRAVCDRHAVSMLSAALQFVAAHPLVVSVIPGPQSILEHTQNVAALEASIPAAFWSELKAEELLHSAAPVPASA